MKKLIWILGILVVTAYAQNYTPMSRPSFYGNILNVQAGFYGYYGVTLEGCTCGPSGIPSERAEVILHSSYKDMLAILIAAVNSGQKVSLYFGNTVDLPGAGTFCTITGAAFGKQKWSFW